ncbi:hypothetical protein ABBQ32_003975 [Trebouxia sp. C0010 RCD-2024]
MLQSAGALQGTQWHSKGHHASCALLLYKLTYAVPITISTTKIRMARLPAQVETWASFFLLLNLPYFKVRRRPPNPKKVQYSAAACQTLVGIWSEWNLAGPRISSPTTADN